MIVIDTSVWLRALRAGDSREAETLRALLGADEACSPPSSCPTLTTVGAVASPGEPAVSHVPVTLDRRLHETAPVEALSGRASVYLRGLWS